MKKNLINYGLFSLALFVVTVLIMSSVSSNEDTKSEAKPINKVQVTTTVTVMPVPTVTYVPDATSEQIPDPCQSLSIESVNKYAPNSIVRGNLYQNSIAPTKGCIWSINQGNTGTIGVTILLSSEAFDRAQEVKVRDVAVGEAAFLTTGFTSIFQNSGCGNTVIAKLRNFTFYVAYCNEEKPESTEKIAIELANEVANSLP